MRNKIQLKQSSYFITIGQFIHSFFASGESYGDILILYHIDPTEIRNIHIMNSPQKTASLAKLSDQQELHYQGCKDAVCFQIGPSLNELWNKIDL